MYSDSLYDLPELPSPPLPFAVPAEFKGVDLREFNAMFRIDGELMMHFIGDILSLPPPTEDDLNQRIIFEIRKAAKVKLFDSMVGYDSQLAVFADDPDELPECQEAFEVTKKAYQRIVEARIHRDQERMKSQTCNSRTENPLR